MRQDILENQFDEYFDKIFPAVKFGILEYSSSHVLKRVDPMAYHQEFLNWRDANRLPEDQECYLQQLYPRIGTDQDDESVDQVDSQFELELNKGFEGVKP